MVVKMEAVGMKSGAVNGSRLTELKIEGSKPYLCVECQKEKLPLNNETGYCYECFEKLKSKHVTSEGLEESENKIWLEQFKCKTDEEKRNWEEKFKKFNKATSPKKPKIVPRDNLNNLIETEKEVKTIQVIPKPLPNEKKLDEEDVRESTDEFNWLKFSEKEIEELNEDDIKSYIQKLRSQPDKLKWQPLDMLQKLYGNKIVKTRVRVEGIEKGQSLLKGFDCKCPDCGRRETIYNPYITTTEDKCRCYEVGSRGGKKFLKLERKSLNDTGYECEIVDPASNANITPHKMFLSLGILPKTQKEIDIFDKKLFTNEMEVTGIIRVYQNKERYKSGWFIDVTDYKFIEKEVVYDVKKIISLNDKPRDNKFFDEYYAPGVYESHIRKKIFALHVCTPIRVQFPNGETRQSFIRSIQMGDPGVAKTVLSKKGFVEYTSGRAEFFSGENATTKGLIVRTTKGSSGRWVASMGVIPRYHEGGIVLDGIGKLDQVQQSELRGIKEEGVAMSLKASGNVKLPAELHFISLGNLKRKVSEYPTKHQASFDLAINHTDISGKFSGADRRREDFVCVMGAEDISTTDVQRNLLKRKAKQDFDDVAFWSNVNAFAWSRKPESIEWEKDIDDFALDYLSKLNKKYKPFEQDYGIFGKDGSNIFMKMLPGVAILHGSIRDEAVIVKKDHATWLYNLYLDVFHDLGLDIEQEKENYYEVHADMIYNNATPQQKELLYLLSIYGTQTAIEKAGKMTRKTIYNRLKDIVSYEFQLEGQENKSKFSYSFHEGSVKKSCYIDAWEATSELDSLMKNDGTFTQFGRSLVQKAKNLFQAKKVRVGGSNE